MNGVAQLAACAGYSVSGSDRTANPEIFPVLEAAGIRIVPQDGSGITPETAAVIYSTAIEADNPDLIRAHTLGVPVYHRADMLAQLCGGKELIAVAGTAGKSTVTGLLGWIFECLGKDPAVYCGAPVLNWKVDAAPPPRNKKKKCGGGAASTLGNVRFGNGPWIIEADESDKSFLKFYPHHAIITNIAPDHFPLPELEKLFAEFEAQVSGVVIKTPEHFAVSSPMPGRHNIENVNNALTLCKALGFDLQKCMAAVRSFQGIERRLERVSDKVIDDFAHSPIKIEAAIEAVSEIWPEFSVCWRPHGFAPLFNGLAGFIETFHNAWRAGAMSHLFIMPVFYAGGTASRKIDSEGFVEQLNAAGIPAEYAPDFPALEHRLRAMNLPVLSMGARDPELPKFARRLASLLK